MKGLKKLVVGGAILGLSATGLKAQSPELYCDCDTFNVGGKVIICDINRKDSAYLENKDNENLITRIVRRYNNEDNLSKKLFYSESCSKPLVVQNYEQGELKKEEFFDCNHLLMKEVFYPDSRDKKILTRFYNKGEFKEAKYSDWE